MSPRIAHVDAAAAIVGRTAPRERGAELGADTALFLLDCYRALLGAPLPPVPETSKDAPAELGDGAAPREGAPLERGAVRSGRDAIADALGAGDPVPALADRMSARLHHQDMGEITVEVCRGEAGVSISFLAETPASSVLLLGHAAQLRAWLADKGVEVQDVTVSVRRRCDPDSESTRRGRGRRRRGFLTEA